jgi:hypothetical protein
MIHCAGIALAAICGLHATCLAAQEIDPLLASAEIEDQQVQSAWTFAGDAAVRAESTGGFTTREDIERLRARVRLGAAFDDGEWEFRLLGKLGQSTSSNLDTLRNLDNEKANAAGLDEAALSWRSDGLRWQIGKAQLPLISSPLTWDRDLRPVGGHVAFERALGEFSRWKATVSYFAPDHLYEDASRLAAGQMSWFFNEGATLDGEFHLGYWDYSALDGTASSGLMRSNRFSQGRLLSDFDLLNLQGVLRYRFGDKALETRLDVVENLGAARESRGARLSIVYGSSRVPGQWELATAFQRIGRDAVPAAFNEDDWWFHSAARGVMPWVAYGINTTWSVQLSGFFERADGRDERISRYLLDLRAQW